MRAAKLQNPCDHRSTLPPCNGGSWARRGIFRMLPWPVTPSGELEVVPIHIKEKAHGLEPGFTEAPTCTCRDTHRLLRNWHCNVASFLFELVLKLGVHKIPEHAQEGGQKAPSGPQRFQTILQTARDSAHHPHAGTSGRREAPPSPPQWHVGALGGSAHVVPALHSLDTAASRSSFSHTFLEECGYEGADEVRRSLHAGLPLLGPLVHFCGWRRPCIDDTYRLPRPTVSTCMHVCDGLG